MHHYTIILLFVATGLCVGQMMTRSSITLENNQYRNVLVAIGNDVPEDTNLIERIKAVFTETSQNLFDATLRRAYIDSVTIVVPQSWTNKPEYLRATTETFDKANIIVDKANAEYGNNPYVLQLGGCGVEGEYMHLTPEYLTEEASSVRLWGPYGKTLTHEWAHLRWGLFDEYAVDGDGDRHFYHSSSGQVEAVRCTLDVAGDRLHRLTGRACRMNSTTSLPENDCRLFPNYPATEASASYMFFHFMPSITTFCDNNTRDVLTLHNIESPNKHNRLCAGKSSWEVMREHTDFRNGRNPPAEGDVDTRPSFKVVQRQDTMRVVVIMDTSGSMNTNDNIKKLNQAIRRYILTTLPVGSKVGLVKFALKASILAPLTELSDDNARAALADKVPTVANGATAMGKGMQKGIQVLEAGGADPAGSIMILIGDGNENVEPFIQAVLPVVLRKKIVVDTILYTARADNQLISLAATTGGMSFFYSGETDSSALRDALTTTSNQRQDDKTKLSVKVSSETFSVPRKSARAGRVYIDSVLGADTHFLFTWNISDPLDNIDVIMTGPGGDVFDSSYKNYEKQNGEILVTIGNSVEQGGQWTFNITNKAAEKRTVLLSVDSKIKDAVKGARPVSVVATVSAVELNFTSDVSSTVAIYAKVSKGYSPLVNAQVVALIERPSSTGMDVSEMPLKDNGAGADNTKDDGIYSGYFTKFIDSDGDYSVSVKVKNDDGQAKIKTVTGQRALRVQFNNTLDSPEDGAEASYETAERFERATPGGYFKTSGIASRINSGRTDFFAPSRITDLRVVEASYHKRTITLEFTAVGDDFVDGNASSYEIKVANNFTDLYNDFDNSANVTQEQITRGNVTSPAQPFAKETFVIQVSEIEYTSTFVYAIRAHDEAGNKGPVSNIVSATLIRVDEVDVVVIVLSVLAVLVVVGVVVAGVFLYRSKFAKTGKLGVSAKQKDAELGKDNKACRI